MENAYIQDNLSVIKRYQTELNNFKPIKSRTRERQLIIKAKKGDYKAQNTLLLSNLAFIFKTAFKYKNYGIPLEHLISEGNMAIIHAIKKFDVDTNVKFITYASYWVRFFISDYIKKNKLKDKKEKSIEENIKAEFNNSIKDNILYDDENSSSSDTDIKCENLYASSTSNAFSKQDAVLEKLLSVLNDREAVIIKKYYGIENNEKKNLEEISKILKISKERVRQIKDTGIMKMRSEAMLIDDVGDIWF